MMTLVALAFGEKELSELLDMKGMRGIITKLDAKIERVKDIEKGRRDDGTGHYCYEVYGDECSLLEGKDLPHPSHVWWRMDE